MMTKFHFLEIAFTGCKTLHLRLSTLLSSCQTTKLYLCLMGIKQLVLRILHLQREGRGNPRKLGLHVPSCGGPDRPVGRSDLKVGEVRLIYM